MDGPTEKTLAMCSLRGRLALARRKLEAEDPVLTDAWYEPCGVLHGRTGEDGYEYLGSAEIMAALGLPPAERTGAAFRRLAAVMERHGWQRTKLTDGRRRVRGFRRKAQVPPDEPAPDLEAAAAELLAEWRRDDPPAG